MERAPGDLFGLAPHRSPLLLLAVVEVACSWHDGGMTRTRISTTVDTDLLAHARAAFSGSSDAKLIDEALASLVARFRSTEIDAAYVAAYAQHPLDEADEWGDLSSFRAAAAST